MVIGSVARALNFLADKRQRDVMVCLTIAQYFSDATVIPPVVVVIVFCLRFFLQSPSITWSQLSSISLFARNDVTRKYCGGAKKTGSP